MIRHGSSPRTVSLVVLVAGLVAAGCSASRDGATASIPSQPAASGAAGPAKSKPASAPAPAAMTATPVPATQGQSVLVLKDGQRIPCIEGPIIALGKILYKTPDGIQHALAQDLVDMDRTQIRAPAPPATAQASTKAATPGAKPTVPDFEATRADGKKVKLSALHGKVVLVDFWATWCGPCMMEMPNVKALYAKLGGKDDFEIVGVSLDSDFQRMSGYVHDQGIAWPMYFDGRGWGNKVANEWGVRSIPTAILLDRDGNVARAGLRGQDLEFAVAQLIAEPWKK